MSLLSVSFLHPVLLHRSHPLSTLPLARAAFARKCHLPQTVIKCSLISFVFLFLRSSQGFLLHLRPHSDLCGCSPVLFGNRYQALSLSYIVLSLSVFLFSHHSYDSPPLPRLPASRRSPTSSCSVSPCLPFCSLSTSMYSQGDDLAIILSHQNTSSPFKYLRVSSLHFFPRCA